MDWETIITMRSAKRIQSDAWCKMPTRGILFVSTFACSFTNIIDDLVGMGTASFIFKMKV